MALFKMQLMTSVPSARRRQQHREVGQNNGPWTQVLVVSVPAAGTHRSGTDSRTSRATYSALSTGTSQPRRHQVPRPCRIRSLPLPHRRHRDGQKFWPHDGGHRRR